MRCPLRPPHAGAVGRQSLLVGPEALRRDVGRAAALQQDQAVRRLVDRPPGPGPARHLPPRVDSAVPVAVVAGIDRMMQHILKRLPIGSMPLQLPPIGPAVRPNRQADTVMYQGAKQPVQTPLAIELVKTIRTTS